jgi:hypothetical protein
MDLSNYYRLKPVALVSAGSRLKIILGFEVTIGRFDTLLLNTDFLRAITVI